MWTRAIMVVACCLAASSIFTTQVMAQGGAEVIDTPAPFQQMSGAMPCEMACDVPYTPPTTPWYYWWSSWHWFDRYHDRGQHYPYLPPLPGWYYFRPYSISQLRAQQEAVMQWGGDPRNPYAVGTLPPPEYAPRPATVVPLSSTRTSSSSRYEVAVSYAAPASQPSAVTIIPWPTVLRDPRFATERARIEDPYRRSLSGQGAPTATDYQEMIDAAAQMKAILWQMTAEISEQDSLTAEKFLDQLAIEARGQLRVGAATVSSQPY